MSKAKIDIEAAPKVEPGLTADRLAYLISLIGIIILPVFFLPGVAIPLVNSKVLWLIVVTLAVLISWLIGRLQTGELVIPKNFTLLGALVVVIVFLISSLSVGNITHSLIGSGFDRDATATVATLFLLFFLLSLIFNRRERVMNFYLWLFAASFLVGLYSLFKILSEAYFPIGALALSSFNLIGSWYGLGIFFGFIGLSSLVVLELFPVRESRFFKYLLLTAFTFSLVMLALVNFYPTWIIFGFSALLLFVYVSTVGGPEAGEPKFESPAPAVKPLRNIKVIRPAFIALLISLFFIVLGGPGGLVSDLIDRVYNQVNFTFVDVRPSWSSTGEVVRATLKDDALLGLGPNNFDRAWALYKPDQINELVYWNTSFNAGVGLLPSTVATAGLLGAVAWFVFLSSLLYFGLKSIFDKNQNPFSRLLVFLLFIGALYLWTFAIIYPVAITLWAMAFITSGLLIGQLSGSGITRQFNLSLIKDPRVNFVSVLVIVIIIMVGLSGIYLSGQKYWAAGIFFNSLSGSSENREEITRRLTRVINLDDNNDLYFRTLAQNNRLTMVNLLQTTGLSADELQQRFQDTLIQGVNNTQRAINLNTEEPDNWLTLGLIYELLVPLEVPGASEQAEATYQRARELSPKNPSILVDLARLSFTRGDPAAARSYLDEALRLKSNYTTALFMLAQIDLAAGNRTEALARAEQAVLLSPNDPATHFQLGFIRYRTDDFSGAAEALEQSLTLSPNNLNANSQYFLGLSYAELGRLAEAIKQFEVIERFNPANTEIKQILANLQSGRSALNGVGEPSPAEDITPPIEETNSAKN